MRVLPTILLVISQLPQQDAAHLARKLIEQLRSDKIETRGEAEARLKQLGKGALPELEKAAQDKDAEVAGRVARLIRIIKLGESLPVRLHSFLDSPPLRP